jgi:hypothetical protein
MSQRKFLGETLSDLTTFSNMQNIFEGKNKVGFNNVLDVDSLIELLLFNEKIWIISPTRFGYNNIKVEIPEFLADLTQDKVINLFTPTNCYKPSDFSLLYQEMQEIIGFTNLDKFLSANPKIYRDLELFDNIYHFSQQEDVLELIKQSGINNRKLIPVVVQLVRLNIYRKSLHQIKNIDGNNISYVPHYTRNALIQKFCDEFVNKSNAELKRVILQIESSEREERSILNFKHKTAFEMELPILTTMVLNQCGENNIQDIIDVCRTLRKSKDIKNLRRWFISYQNAIDSGNLNEIKKYDSQLDAILEDFQQPSHTISLKSIPEMGFEFSKDGGIQPSVAISKAVEKITKFWMNKDLLFLVNLNARIKKINYSKKEFQRVFGYEFKLRQDLPESACTKYAPIKRYPRYQFNRNRRRLPKSE